MVDCYSEDNWCLIQKEIEKAITPRTKSYSYHCIYWLLFADYGLPLWPLAKKHIFMLLKDCAHKQWWGMECKKAGVWGLLVSFRLSIVQNI